MNFDMDNAGMYLIEKSRKGIISLVFSRTGIIAVIFLLQIWLMFAVFRWFEGFLPHIFGGAIIFTAVMVLLIINGNMDPTAKITWLIIIMLLPVFGSLLYFYIQSDLGHRVFKRRFDALTTELKETIPQDEELKKRILSVSPESSAIAQYIKKSGCYPIYENTEVTYFPSGEEKFKALLEELKKAEKFIFLEYFIINEGIMWGQILEILSQKAAEGVDVRVIYDGTCEFTTLPHDYPKRLEKLGIKCKVFLPLTPLVSTSYNYRDHRKILVIDGHTAFNGGVNLADEYINHIERFGYWKDTAIMLKGDAVKSFTLMFLQVWSIDKTEEDINKFVYAPYKSVKAEGFVLPYADCPLDGYKVGERVYMDILNRAEKYVHIMTPYLILDGEMETAIKFAAERGVDVSIILPGIPDKKIPYALAKTHYASLMASGVKIYEFTPGFVHAKVFVSDDERAVVGTINLDYRSLYHHFECATYMYGTKCIKNIENDFEETIKKCKMADKNTIKENSLYNKAVGFAVKAFAPLM